ncbi:MAG TPA: YbjQ family protein [Herpetosiphonaceae bacterium]
MEQSPRTIKFQLDHRNITTAFELPGYRIEQSLGIVLGITVRSANMVGSIKAGLKTVIGGNIGTWTDMCNQARQEAFDQMVQHAAALGANAVIGMRYDANDISSMATEVLAYGTAVVVEPISRS